SEEAGAAERLAQYQQEIAVLQTRVNSTLLRIGNKVGSVPEFNAEMLNPASTGYVFYKPIVYSRRGEDAYFRGLVRLGVSTERIITEIANSRINLLIRIGIITLIAIAMGVGGALLFSAIMIIPINKLLKGVEKIRDTEDKEELSDHVILVRARDEIHSLADTVNQMTQGLVKAAAAAKMLSVGKEIQKRYIPLETDAQGNKMSTGKESNEFVEFFGYYEGAKGVSGDYFDYVQVDPEHYVIVKCDISGKGVPAALIMVQVATLVINYYKNWDLKTQGIHLDKLLYIINDLLEERGFKGKFAALIAIVLNIKTGVAYMCHAGDNIVNLYDAEKNAMTQITMAEAPAAGALPNIMLEMKGGYKQVTYKMKAGDCMFLYTDGIEETTRMFRDSSFKPIICQEPGFKEGEMHGNHRWGDTEGVERLEAERVQEVLNAVLNRSTFRFTKYHNPIPDEEFIFDFSSCQGTVEEAVLGLVAVQNVFRLVKDPSAGTNDRVNIDFKVDGFIKKHFTQYSSYFAHPVEASTTSAAAVYSHLKQDEQYDDLTILSVRKL
ncbi:MAG: HAMP domain-containing protein, partial [Spirochaetales bacterium]